MCSQEAEGFTSGFSLRRDLSRLARFGANLSDAHSCFIFLPSELLRADSCQPADGTEAFSEQLELAAYHTLSCDVLPDCMLTSGSGLIGWVAKHARSIHVSPFERDSKLLGIYGSDQELKSFIGIPIPLSNPDKQNSAVSGVVACDSCKSFAFSKLQGKLLEELACEISNVIKLHFEVRNSGKRQDCWQDFLRGAIGLAESLGRESLAILRLRLRNFDSLERELGTPDCLELLNQVYRLIRQAIPEHFPLLVLGNGDIVVALDSMASSFYESRIRAICTHRGIEGRQPIFEFSSRSFREKQYRSASIERLVTETAFIRSESGRKEELYEYRRA